MAGLVVTDGVYDQPVAPMAELCAHTKLSQGEFKANLLSRHRGYCRGGGGGGDGSRRSGSQALWGQESGGAGASSSAAGDGQRRREQEGCRTAGKGRVNIEEAGPLRLGSLVRWVDML
jgi:hypothetical protein